MSNVGIMINTDVNVNNWLIKVRVIKDILGRYCECECDKSCNIVDYLDYENCKCGKRFLDKLIN